MKNERLVARRIGSVDQNLFASPTCLAVRTADPAGRPGGARITANNVGLMRLLAERGMVIAMLDPSLVRELLANGGLHRMPPE